MEKIENNNPSAIYVGRNAIGIGHWRQGYCSGAQEFNAIVADFLYDMFDIPWWYSLGNAYIHKHSMGHLCYPKIYKKASLIQQVCWIWRHAGEYEVAWTRMLLNSIRQKKDIEHFTFRFHSDKTTWRIYWLMSTPYSCNNCGKWRDQNHFCIKHLIFHICSRHAGKRQSQREVICV